MHDDEVDEALARAVRLGAEAREKLEARDRLIREILDTRKRGVRNQVAKALGVSPEAVRQKYGPVHTISSK
jgi:predicted transcriptional regulator